jgi:hypothetical protein
MGTEGLQSGLAIWGWGVGLEPNTMKGLEYSFFPFVLVCWFVLVLYINIHQLNSFGIDYGYFTILCEHNW